MIKKEVKINIMAGPVGIEPTSVGIKTRCVNRFATAQYLYYIEIIFYLNCALCKYNIYLVHVY